MSIFRGQMIRGDQIQNRTVSGDQIIQKVLMDEHIADNAAINETKLNINWHAHTEALEDRKIVDFVQANQISISGTGIDLEAAIPEISGIAVATSNGTTEGIISTGPKNLAPMRNSITGDPLVAVKNDIDYEVIARVEYVDGKYALNFYTASGVDGAEEACDVGSTPITVDIQYARRFNLRSVDEMFAANEKFVHGAADITAHLNIQQVAKDLYGASWKLDRDGNPILATSIADQIKNEIQRAQDAEAALQHNIDLEVSAREQADETLGTSLNNEVLRATGAESTLDAKIVAETNRATGAESTLDGKITTEVTRATDAEQALGARIDALTTGTGDSSAALQTAINAEKDRAIAAEGALQDAIDQEIADRAAAITGVNTSLTNEVTRATTAEATLTTNLNKEITDRTDADTVLDGKITTEKNRAIAAEQANADAIAAEVTRATTAEGQLTTDLTAEVNRAKAAEKANSDAIAAEVTRATTAEQAIQDSLDAEVLRAKAAEKANADALAQEIIDRGAADTTIQNALDAEVVRAKAAEKVVSDGLAQEIIDRKAADQTIQDEIDVLNGNSGIAGSVDNKIKVQVTDVLASTAGAGKVGIVSIPGMTGVTTVQAALEYLKANAGDALTTLVTDLSSDATGKGASLVAVQTGSGLNATNVQGVLVDHEGRLDAIEAGNLGSGLRSASTNGYFAEATFTTLDSRFESDEAIVDANLKRIDDRDIADKTRSASANGYFAAGVQSSVGARIADVETVADATAQEVKVARGSKADLNERLSVALRADGYLVDDAKIHEHVKYTYVIAAETSIVNLPIGQKFNLSSGTGSGSVAKNTVQVYINGILQANGINFVEIADTVDVTKGVGVNFTPEELVIGDVVVIEWVVNNAN